MPSSEESDPKNGSSVYTLRLVRGRMEKSLTVEKLGRRRVLLIRLKNYLSAYCIQHLG